MTVVGLTRAHVDCFDREVGHCDGDVSFTQNRNGAGIASYLNGSQGLLAAMEAQHADRVSFPEPDRRPAWSTGIPLVVGRIGKVLPATRRSMTGEGIRNGPFQGGYARTREGVRDTVADVKTRRLPSRVVKAGKQRYGVWGARCPSV